MPAQSHVVPCLLKPRMPSAIGAAKKLPAALDAVSDHAAPTVLAHWSQLMDRTFKAVKHVTVTGCDHLEAQRIIVTANFADCHAYETDLITVDHAVTVMRSNRLHSKVPKLYPHTDTCRSHSFRTFCLKNVLQRKLHLTHRARRDDSAERSCIAGIRRRRVPVRMIGRVERLPPELKRMPLANRDVLR